ncbi:hypothetical protein CXB51_036964 [Gossypium anomalum]|uniref:Uncharacterized protein n=1 Tax=Gossypium anomalum TaxID=47600 RepID=A0A8J5Y7S5_9ROSI|nr:hypothetical protein CXB51_036964 [Gossypium anomalum]
MPRKILRDLSIVQNHPDSEETNSEQQTTIESSNVSNTGGEPVEIQKARLLAGYLGIIARNANLLPINYESWYHMPDSNKNQDLDNIKERFALEPRIEIAKCSAENAEDSERVGTTSRQKQKFTHTTGSKSFACVAEAEELSSGQKVGCLQLFDITHRKKDGYPMTSEAAEIMEKLKDKKAEYEAIASSDSSVNLYDIDNRIIIEVLGPERHGRVQFQGSFINPTQYFGSSSQQYMPSRTQAQAEVQRLRD